MGFSYKLVQERPDKSYDLREPKPCFNGAKVIG